MGLRLLRGTSFSGVGRGGYWAAPGTTADQNVLCEQGYLDARAEARGRPAAAGLWMILRAGEGTRAGEGELAMLSSGGQRSAVLQWGQITSELY